MGHARLLQSALLKTFGLRFFRRDMVHMSREDIKNLAARLKALRVREKEESLGDNIFDWGKFKGRTFEEVFEEEKDNPRGYVDWSVSNFPSPSPGQDRWLKFISDRIGERESHSQASSDQIGESQGQASSDQIGQRESQGQASSDQIGQSERQPQASTDALPVEALQGSLVELTVRVAMLEGIVKQIADELLAGTAHR